jgi:hypothetical protein
MVGRMPRFTKRVITLPLLALALAGLAPAAGAEPVTQLDALRLLAKSHATNGKCKTLSPGDADELNGYLARAEIAAASRHSVSEVQSSISLGRALGHSTMCSDRSKAEVGSILAAARQAMAEAADPPRAAVQDEPPPARSEKIKLRGIDAQRHVSLAGYGRQAFAYYVERRCEYLSRRQIRAFWAAIVREHRAALGAYGGAAVARTLRRVRVQAERMGCDAAGRQLVQSEYVKLARN